MCHQNSNKRHELEETRKQYPVSRQNANTSFFGNWEKQGNSIKTVMLDDSDEIR